MIGREEEMMNKFLEKVLNPFLYAGAFFKVVGQGDDSKNKSDSNYKKAPDFLSPDNDEIKTKSDLDKFIDQRRAANSIPFPVPKELDGQVVEVIDDGPMRTFIWNDQGDSDQTVLMYLHGGSYFKQPKGHYFDFLNHFAKDLHAKIVMPIYPKGPEYTFKDSQDKLLNIYQNILDQVSDRSKIILMGDSAGGGLMMGLADLVAKNNLPAASDLILISPWLDIATDNPVIEDFKDVDPSLVQWQLQVYGRIWADGEENFLNPMVSPIYSQHLYDLPKISLFVGGHELFFPDNELLHEKLIQLDIPHNFIVGQRLHHIFPVKDPDKGPVAREWMVKILEDDLVGLEQTI